MRASVNLTGGINLKKHRLIALFSALVIGSTFSFTSSGEEFYDAQQESSYQTDSNSPTNYLGADLGYNDGLQNYSDWASVVTSYLTECENGEYMKVQAFELGGHVYIDYIDKNFNLLRSKEIDTGMRYFGGFYETEDNYYILSGKNNPKSDDSCEVMRITKYDKSWNKIKSAKLYGGNTCEIFAGGSARMAHKDNYLFIKTCHTMYDFGDGLHHQASLMIIVDMNTMKIVGKQLDVSNNVSHSFNQFIKFDSDDLLTIDHGDGNPRAVRLSKYTDLNDHVSSYYRRGSYKDLFKISGDYGDNFTGVSVGGFEISPSNYITVGNTIDQKKFIPYSMRNIFVSTVSKDMKTKKLTKLTSYKSDNASTPHIVKINDDEFLVMWTKNNEKICYTLLNGQGEKQGKTYSFTGKLSDCAPIISDNKVLWYVWYGENIYFYSIDINDISQHDIVTLKENPNDLSNAVAELPAETYTFTGKTQKPSPTVTLNGKKLKNGTDYTVSYKNNKAIGKAYVIVKGKNNYTGTIKKSFNIVPQKQVIVKLSAQAKAFSVKWTLNKNVTGYQIKYSTASNFSGGKSVYVKKNTSTKKTLTSLKSKKTYYVKVRSYKTVNGVKYYGAWSKAKKIKTK